MLIQLTPYAKEPRDPNDRNAGGSEIGNPKAKLVLGFLFALQADSPSDLLNSGTAALPSVYFFFFFP